MLRSISLRCAFNVIKQIQRPSSTATTVVPSSDKPVSDGATVESNPTDAKKVAGKKKSAKKSELVTAAFTGLNFPRSTPKDSLDQMILEAKTPEELLTLSQSSAMSRKQALRIVTTLAEWSVNGPAEMSKFEMDPRFVALCQLLGRGSNPQSTNNRSPAKQQGDLSVVLGVTGDDEAAKLVSTITLPQMIKVLSSLALKKRRSIPLLRSLAFNIGRSPIKLDIKQGADILYSLTSLNFPDDVLLEKVCSDINECIPKCLKSSVIGSISTSYGLLRYKDTEILDSLAEWFLNNKTESRSQDVVSFLLTLAAVNHIPSAGDKFFEQLIPSFTSQDLPSATVWLDFIWSIAILGHASHQHLSSILSEQFIDRISSSHSRDLNFSWKRKLLNLNGVAKLTKGYNGPFINPEKLSFPLTRPKDKQQLVNSVIDALTNLLPSSVFLRTNIDTGMGFLIDGECLIDSKMTPLPVVDKKTGQPIPFNAKGSKIAIMIWDYHDNTRGKVNLTGSCSLTVNLLNTMGYKVLSISHTEYNPKDKLSQRVQFLENQLKSIVSTSS